MEEDGAGNSRLGFKLRDQLVCEVDIPRAFDLGQHDDVVDVAGLGDDLGDVVEEPGRVERVHPRPQTRAEFLPVDHAGHLDGAGAGLDLGVGGDGVFEVGEDDVDLGGHVRRLGADLLVMAGHEMNHALQLDRQLAQRLRRADGERLEELAGGLGAHERVPVCVVICVGGLRECIRRAKRLRE